MKPNPYFFHSWPFTSVYLVDCLLSGNLLSDFSRLHPILFPIYTNSGLIFSRKVRNKFITQSQIGNNQTPQESWRYRLGNSKRSMKYLLGWLIAGTRGGATRAKMIETLNETPQNANQLANHLGMDYRTIRHHLKVLEKNRLITAAGEGYGTTYFLSPALEENYGVFEEIVNKMWKK